MSAKTVILNEVLASSSEEREVKREPLSAESVLEALTFRYFFKPRSQRYLKKKGKQNKTNKATNKHWEVKAGRGRRGLMILHNHFFVCFFLSSVDATPSKIIISPHPFRCS